MKKIIKGILYDTDTAEFIYEDARQKRRLYRTPAQNYFLYYQDGDITAMTEESAKEYLGNKDADKYIEIWGLPVASEYPLSVRSVISRLEVEGKETVEKLISENITDTNKVINIVLFNMVYYRDLISYLQTITKESELAKAYYGMDIPDKYSSALLKSYDGQVVK